MLSASATGMLLTISIIGFAVTAIPSQGEQASQESKNRVIKKREYADEPIRFSSIKVKGNEVNLGVEFAGDDNWLRDISLEIQNVSGKNIVAVEVNIIVNNIKGRIYPTGIPLKYGHMPAPENKSALPQALLLNEKVTLTVASDMFSVLEQRVKERDSLSNIIKVELYPAYVLFEDGIMWAGGQTLYPNKEGNSSWGASRDKSHNTSQSKGS